MMSANQLEKQKGIMFSGAEAFRSAAQGAEMSARTVVLIACMACFALGAVPSQAQVSTGFDADLEGWMVTGDNSAAWEPATGNPGGCLSVNDWAIGDMNYIIAPMPYLGGWSAATASDSLVAEIYFDLLSGSVINPAYIFRLAGPGGAARALIGSGYYPAENVWNRYAVSLDQLDWTLESGTWEALMEDVRSLRLMGEFVTGTEIVRLDNVSLSFTPGYVWAECVTETFTDAGTGDWSYSGTSGASNPGSGGNGGGYFKVDDAGSFHSYAYAPSRFLGDWSPLDGSGVVTIDIRVLKGLGTNNGSTEFIRLSGPGGVAHVSLDASELPTAARVWKTFTYLVDSSVWQLDSGTWSGLLSSVTECRIDLEYFTEDEDIGFDNFGRLAAGCPAVDDPVVLHSPYWAKCGYHSFVGARTAALNPLNGVVHSIVRETTTYGGGVYEVSGPNPGTYLHAYDRPADVMFDGNGNAFISEDYDGEVYRLTPAGASTLWVAGFHSGDDDPFGMTIAPPGFNGPNVTEGDVIVSDRGNSGADQVWTFSPLIPEGELLLMPDPGSVDFFDLAGAPDTLVYMMDALDGTTLSVLDSLGVLDSAPLSIDVGTVLSLVYDSELDDIYVASNDSACIYRIDPATGDVELVASGFSNLTHCCLEIDPVGRRLWAADNFYNRIYEFCLEGAVGVEQAHEGELRSGVLRVYPNPANPAVVIEFGLGVRALVKLDVFDASGRRVRSLLHGEFPEGVHKALWDGTAENGRAVASGVYFVKLEASGRTEVGRIVLLK